MESVDELEVFYDHTRFIMTQLLLSAGANPNRRDLAGRAALHYAAGAGSSAIELLLSAGAEPNTVDRRGRTALHDAIDRGSISAAVVLCRRGTYLAVRDQDGNTAGDLLLADQRNFTSEQLDLLPDALRTP